MQKFSGVALNQYEILRSFRYVYVYTRAQIYTHVYICIYCIEKPIGTYNNYMHCSHSAVFEF